MYIFFLILFGWSLYIQIHYIVAMTHQMYRSDQIMGRDP